MGNTEWLADVEKIRAEAKAALEEGLITTLFEYEQWCKAGIAKLKAEAEFQAPARPAPKAKLWVPPAAPEVRKAANLPAGIEIDPLTGIAVGLPEAAKAPANTTGKRKAVASDRFGCGVAIVLGFTHGGEPVCERFVVGLTCQDPISDACQLARRIVKSGGQAIYGYRQAGYELRSKPIGTKRDGSVAMGLPDLIPSTSVDGVRGDKGLSLIDARTFYEVPAFERECWWYAHKLIEGAMPEIAKLWAERVGKFIPKPKQGKYSTYKVYYAAQGITREVEKDGPPRESTARTIVLESQWGAESPTWVSWEEPGETKEAPKIVHRLIRAEVLRTLKDEDEGVSIIRDAYIEAEASAEDEIELALAQARLAVEIETYLGPHGRERIDQIVSLEDWTPPPVKLPEHKRRGPAVPFKGEGLSKPHKWEGRARNSKKGATWDRMKRAQAYSGANGQ